MEDIYDTVKNELYMYSLQIKRGTYGGIETKTPKQKIMRLIRGRPNRIGQGILI